MAIQDKALVLQEAQDLSGASASGTAYQFSNSFDIKSIANVVRDVGDGYALWMEFEVTTTFTGYVGAFNTPMLIMGVSLSNDPNPLTAGSVPQVLAAVGWPITDGSGNATPFLGMVPSDATNYPRNLFAGDVYRVRVPGGAVGLPWYGNASARTDQLLHASGFLSAVYIQVARTGQTLVSSEPAAFTLANFTAGAITSRLVIDHITGDNSHVYKPGMVVQ